MFVQLTYSSGVAKKLIDSLDEGLLDEETLPFAFHALQTLTERTISADVYRSIALFIVYSLHRGPVTTNQAIVKESKSEDVKDVEADAFLSDNHKRGPRSTVQASELGIALLEMFVNMFCRGPIGAVHVNKFAKSVSNKVSWRITHYAILLMAALVVTPPVCRK